MLEEEDITKRALRCKSCQEKTEEPLRSLSWSLALSLDVRMCENLTVTEVCGGQLLFKLLLFYEEWKIPRDTMDRLPRAFECKHLPNVHIKCKQVHENTPAFL